MAGKETSLVAVPEKELAEYKTKILGVQQAANLYEIKDSKDLEKGEAMLTTIKEIEKAMTVRKEEITRPMMQALSSIRDLFKPRELDLAEGKKTVKAKMLAFQIEEDARIAKEEARVAARVEKGTMKAETGAGKLETIAASKPKLNTRTLVKVRVVDETAIPREYMMPNMTAITEAILRKNVEIPGVERYEEKVIVTK